MGLTQIEERTPFEQQTTFAAADTTVTKAIAATTIGIYRVDAIWVTSNDTAARVIDLYWNNGSTQSLLGSINLPAGTGTLGTPPVDLAAAVVGVTAGQLVLPAGHGLYAGMEATITAAKTVYVTVVGGTL